MSLNWTDVEHALADWVIAATGYDADHVLFADQNGPQPDGNFITLRFTSLINLGAFDYALEFDSEADPVVVNEEVQTSTVGDREVVVSIQAFTTATVGDASAFAVLSKLRASLALSTYALPLEEAGISVFDTGSLLNLSALVETDFEGRAALDISFYVTDSVTEFSGYIEQVEVLHVPAA